MKADYFPNQYTALPRDGGALTIGDTAITWRAVETVNHNINLALGSNRCLGLVGQWAEVIGIYNDRAYDAHDVAQI